MMMNQRGLRCLVVVFYHHPDDGTLDGDEECSAAARMFAAPPPGLSVVLAFAVNPVSLAAPCQYLMEATKVSCCYLWFVCNKFFFEIYFCLFVHSNFYHLTTAFIASYLDNLFAFGLLMLLIPYSRSLFIL
jgi:hypothetical protein